MRMKKLLLLFSIIAILYGCERENLHPDPEDRPVKFISDDLPGSTTWYTDTIYVIDDNNFFINGTLTIQPGTIIMLQEPGVGDGIMLREGATILANGESDNPIIFTSYKDDAVAGDVNGDGGLSAAAPGDWTDININGGANCVFSNCEFYYGGNGSYARTLDLGETENTLIEFCTFAHNLGAKNGDIYFGVLDANDAGSSTILRYNVFYDNIIPLSVNLEFDLGNSNVFQNAVTSEGNVMNGIFVYTTDQFRTDITWGEDEVAYVIDDAFVSIMPGVTLALADNVVIKFAEDNQLSVQEGGAINQGSNVFFTSLYDDALKGDTNGDGTATGPADGDWVGIYDGSRTTEPFYYGWANILYDSQ